MSDFKSNDGKELDDLLDVAAADQMPVSDQFMQRVLSDAERLQPKMRRPVWRMDWLAALFERPRAGFGAVGGMALVSCVGFWLGINPPPMLESLGVSGAMTLSDTIDEGTAEVSGFGWDLEES